MDKTHWKKLRNPQYIGSYELMTGGEPRDMVVEIVSAAKELVQNGDKKEDCMVVKLKNQKPLIVNATNAKSIASATGSVYVEDWSGKKITLYVAKIKAFGEWHDALRVRKEAPKDDVKHLEDLNPAHSRWEGAVQALKDKKTTLDAIKKTFNINDENLKLLQDAAK